MAGKNGGVSTAVHMLNPHHNHQQQHPYHDSLCDLQIFDDHDDTTTNHDEHDDDDVQHVFASTSKGPSFVRSHPRHASDAATAGTTTSSSKHHRTSSMNELGLPDDSSAHDGCFEDDDDDDDDIDDDSSATEYELEVTEEVIDENENDHNNHATEKILMNQHHIHDDEASLEDAPHDELQGSSSIFDEFTCQDSGEQLHFISADDDEDDITAYYHEENENHEHEESTILEDAPYVPDVEDIELGLQEQDEDEDETSEEVSLDIMEELADDDDEESASASQEEEEISPPADQGETRSPGGPQYPRTKHLVICAKARRRAWYEYLLHSKGRSPDELAEFFMDEDTDICGYGAKEGGPMSKAEQFMQLCEQFMFDGVIPGEVKALQQKYELQLSKEHPEQEDDEDEDHFSLNLADDQSRVSEITDWDYGSIIDDASSYNNHHHTHSLGNNPLLPASRFMPDLRTLQEDSINSDKKQAAHTVDAVATTGDNASNSKLLVDDLPSEREEDKGTNKATPITDTDSEKNQTAPAIIHEEKKDQTEAESIAAPQKMTAVSPEKKDSQSQTPAKVTPPLAAKQTSPPSRSQATNNRARPKKKKQPAAKQTKAHLAPLAEEDDASSSGSSSSSSSSSDSDSSSSSEEEGRRRTRRVAQKKTATKSTTAETTTPFVVPKISNPTAASAFEQKRQARMERLAKAKARIQQEQALKEKQRGAVLSVKERRERQILVFQWYNRLCRPTKAKFLKRIQKMMDEDGYCDITPSDADLLPWVENDKRVDIAQYTAQQTRR